jgi:hypothetical protein
VIREVLHVILTEGLSSTSEIAERIGVQEETLIDIIKLLVTRGYLRRDECSDSGTSSCSHCPVPCGSSANIQTGQAYIVTERGRRFANPLREEE